MFLSDFSIRRPIAMTVVILVLFLAGLSAYRRIGLNVMPDIDIPYVTITTVYPGASPVEIEVDVAKRIEDAVSNVDGLKHVQSNCMENVCVTVLEFQLSVDVDIAAMDVREKLDLILNDLPPDVESPKILKFDPNSKPVATILLTGDLPIDSLYDYADETLSDRLSTLEGVAEVQVTGGEKLEVHITVDRKRLSAAGLTTASIIAKLAENNIKIPAGAIRDGVQEINVTYDSEFKSLDEIMRLEIGSGRDGRIYVGDVAQVEMVSKKNRTKAFYNGTPAVNIKVIKKGEANTVKVVDRIREAVGAVESSGSLPGGMKLVWFTDDAEFIRASVDDAWGSVIMGILLTSLILFMFLHEIRSTAIIALSMPMSVIITFVAMRQFGYTFNNPTLLALGTSVGVLVTNSIIVIENIFTKLGGGSGPREAAAAGTGEVALPVFASATTNVVVFVPIAMMSSIVGRYFTPFAVTMTVATLVSLFISFTLTPILSAVFLRKDMPGHMMLMRLYTGFWNRFYDRLQRGYSRSLSLVRPHPFVFFSAFAAVFVLTFILIVPKVGMTFFPDSDRGEFIIKVEYPSYCNIEENIRRTLEFEKKIRSLPEVLSCSTVIGKVQGVIGQVAEGVYLAEMTVKTTGKNDRRLDMEQMREMFRKEFAQESDCIVTVNVPSIIGGAASEIELEISGDDLSVLRKLGLEACKAADGSGLLADVDNNIRTEKPEIKVVPKRPVLQDMEIPSRLIGTILRGNIEGIKQGTYKSADRSYDIRIVMSDEMGVEQLREFTHSSSSGRPLGLESVANIAQDSIPIQIARDDKRRIVKVFANPAPGVALGDAVKFLERSVSALLPPGYSMRFAGKVEKMKEAQLDFLEAIIAASILTYLLIAAVLESWTQPVIILITLPLSLIGIFSSLYLTGNALSMMGLLGCVMLIGIVVNNAILIMDQLVILRAEGMPPGKAMFEASVSKFRPIIMTSIAAIIGIWPMAAGTGLGSELRSSCGIAVIGGLVSSTILTLYVIPMLYFLFAKYPGPEPKPPESPAEK